jgi:hypothetical protein
MSLVDFFSGVPSHQFVAETATIYRLGIRCDQNALGIMFFFLASSFFYQMAPGISSYHEMLEISLVYDEN